MTTQPPLILSDLSPEDTAYFERLAHALRCGVSGCSCAGGLKLHCPAHPNPEVATLTVGYDPAIGFSFHCTRCPFEKIFDALARRGLLPESLLHTSAGAQEAGLDPFALFIPQPQDWLWPDRIPFGKLTLIAGYPSSGKTAIALDVAARVSRGAPAPDQPHAVFPAAPVVLAPLNGNPKADVLPTLRLFGANLDRIYLADLLSPVHPVDFYPDDPPAEPGPDDPDDEEGWDDDDEAPPRRRRIGMRLPAVQHPFEIASGVAPKHAGPWPGLNHVMKRLANTVEAGSAALLIVDQVEDLASMHRAQVATVLGMLKALAARTGAAVIALTHNPASNYPRAVTAMQRRLAQASVVFTTALVEPGERRFLIPLRPTMSDDAPAIPFVLPPPSDFTIAWRKPVLPAHLHALADPNRDHGARVRAAQTFLLRALADGSRSAVAVEREATLLGISKSALHRARAACGIRTTRVSAHGGSSGAGAWYWSMPVGHTVQQDETLATAGNL